MEKLLCGIDLGGTKLSAGLVTIEGKLIDEIRTHDHIHKDNDGIILDMVMLVNALLERNKFTEEDLLGIGVVFPGHINSKTGISITTSNLATGFKNYPFRASIQKHFNQAKVYVDNDANAQAFAEFKYGAGKGFEDMIFVTVSTGIGAGIIINGRLLRGASGTAGEIGHTIIRPESTRKCTCGNYGCLMTQGCGLFLQDIAKDKIRSGIVSTLGVTLENAQDLVTGPLMKNGLDQGDPLSEAVVYECADAIGIALYNLFQLYNPPIIVLGGGLINWGPIYLDRIREKFHLLAKDMLIDEMKIEFTQIGKDAGVIGASTLPLEFH
ncbi:MAG: ROK family protein [Vallitaleaceae bacterium]|nr:ROK family protein [Vallitaleaceae bacterium]